MPSSRFPHLACIIEKLHEWTDDVIEGDSDRPALHFLHHIRIILNDGRGDELLLFHSIILLYYLNVGMLTQCLICKFTY